ncbi:MAG: sigma 54-interacting transcriptional regulator [Planctomycetes bacterium]|nr:sigma 54-interacting transcriptional regulator [Planctomycetota bacterium]
MPLLVVITEAREIRVPLRPGTTTIGRDPTSDVVVDDRATSRRHARVVVDGGAARIEPWENRNPVLVNGAETRGPRELRSGDRLVVGHTELRYYDDGPENSEPAGTVEFTALAPAAQPASVTVTLDPAGAVARAAETVGEGGGISFGELSQLLSGALRREELIERAGALLFRRFSPAALAILERGEEGEFRPLFLRQASPAPQRGVPAAPTRARSHDRPAVTLSRDLLNRVVETRAALLAGDAGHAPSESAATLEIASAMVVPLFARRGAPLCAPVAPPAPTGDHAAAREKTALRAEPVTGVIYLDRRGPEARAFTADDLEFCTLLGHVLCVMEQNALLFREARDRGENLARRLDRGDGLVFVSRAMADVVALAGKVAATDAAVLITGESGVGKELIARAVHRLSRRAGGPFVAVNCSAFPADLIESELFGAKKGAYTGAVEDREGHFQRAVGGTIFLDEIGDMPAAAQAKILRALQEKRVTPVGGGETPVDVRVITATNRDLREAISRGQFRDDLFYRLNTITIRVPPLRERTDDILPLARHFALAAGASDMEILPAAEQALLAHPWPGNARELRNVVERAVILGDGRTLTADLLEALRAPAPSESDLFRTPSLEEVERRHILRVMRETGGNKSQAAQLLGINRDTLYKKLEKYAASAGPGGRKPRERGNAGT